jgi:hypothetical protein
MSRAEQQNLPQEIIDWWPVVPEVAVGDLVAVQGMWLMESPHGEINTAGLVVYTRMGTPSDDEPSAARPAAPAPGSGWWCHSYRITAGKSDKSFCSRTQPACSKHAELVASGKLEPLNTDFEATAACAVVKEAWTAETRGLTTRAHFVVANEAECRATKVGDGCTRVE